MASLNPNRRGGRQNPRSAAGQGRAIASARAQIGAAPRRLGATALAQRATTNKGLAAANRGRASNIIRQQNAGRISERTAARALGVSVGKFRRTKAGGSASTREPGTGR